MRELRNVIERAVILETTDEIQPASLPDFQLEARLHKAELPTLHRRRSRWTKSMANFERELITATAGAKPFQPDARPPSN